MRAPVWATPLPTAIDSLGKASAALELLYGEGLTFGQSGQYLIVYTPGESCGCLACNKDVCRVRAVAGEDSMFSHDQIMFLCPDCGDKRCAQAADHRQPCDKDMEGYLHFAVRRSGTSDTTTPDAIERLETNYGKHE